MRVRFRLRLTTTATLSRSCLHLTTVCQHSATRAFNTRAPDTRHTHPHTLDGITRPVTIDDIEEWQQETETGTTGRKASLPHSDGAAASFQPALSAPPLPILASVLLSADNPVDTVYQLSSGFLSPSGQTAVGVAIIRISGPLAAATQQLLTRRKSSPIARKATVCTLYHPVTATVLDAPCFSLYFLAPRSFTGDDVVELHVHGNPISVRAIMDALHSIHLDTYHIDKATRIAQTTQSRLREAEAGEFTRRAFLNGKIDLTQVEGLADLLSATTEQQHTQAIQQLNGVLSRQYEVWRLELIGVLAHLEAVLDFSEDEPDVSEHSILHNVLPRLHTLRHSLSAHLDTHHRGELIRQGVSVMILGAPNAGKSTLMNTLAQRDVSIVSPVAGTTRDMVEVALNIAGYAVNVIDSAGLRRMSEDVVEKEGIRRAVERAANAQIKLVLIDTSQLETDRQSIQQQIRDIQELIDSQTILVFTKIDTLSTQQQQQAHADMHTQRHNKSRTQVLHREKAGSEAEAVLVQARLQSMMNEMFDVWQDKKKVPAAWIAISCTQSIGIEALLTAISQLVKQTLNTATYSSSRQEQQQRQYCSTTHVPVITRHRHRLHVQDCMSCIDASLLRLSRNDLVLAAEQLRQAVRCLGRIVGRVDVEEILDVIFADFCIGK